MKPSSDSHAAKFAWSQQQMPRAARVLARTFAELPPRYQELVRLMQRVRYGTLRGLRVRGGEPDLASPVQVERQLKLGVPSTASPAMPESDFALKAKVLELIDILVGVGDGSVTEIEIRDGLPEVVRLAGEPVT